MAKNTDNHGWPIPEAGDTDYEVTFASFFSELDLDVVLRGTVSNRPSAGESNRIYIATDEATIYHDNGNSWDEIGGKNFTDPISADSIELNRGGSSDASLQFSSDSNTGIWSPGANRVGIATGGNKGLEIDSSQNLIVPGGDITDGTNTIWDDSNGYIPQGRLENDSVTVAGNSVSLGGTTGVAYGDLSDTGTFPITNSDLSNSSVSVAGNSVSLGGSTTVAYGDLSDTGTFPITNSDLSNSSVSVAGNSVSLGGTTSVAYGDLSDTGTFPITNSDLSNSSVSVAGNSVSLGGSTTVAYGDLSDTGTFPITNSDLSNSSISVAGNSVSLGGSTSISAHDLSDSGSVAMLDEAESVTSKWTFNNTGESVKFTSSNSDNHYWAFEDISTSSGADVYRFIAQDSTNSVTNLAVKFSGTNGALNVATGTLQQGGTDVALTSRFPLPNSDLSNSSVSVAGNSVSLGGSTSVAYGDLSDTGTFPITNSDLSNSSVSVAGNSISLGGSTTISSGDLSDSGDIAHVNSTETISSGWQFSADFGLNDGTDILFGTGDDFGLYYDSANDWVKMEYNPNGTPTDVGRFHNNGDVRFFRDLEASRDILAEQGYLLQSGSTQSNRYGLKYGSTGSLDDTDDIMLTNREAGGDTYIAANSGTAGGEAVGLHIPSGSSPIPNAPNGIESGSNPVPYSSTGTEYDIQKNGTDGAGIINFKTN